MADLKQIKLLREKTGAGFMDCKKALEETGGDINKAIEILRKKGQKIAQIKMERKANEGIIEAYVHNTGRVGALIQLNCETDFVARNDEFKKLAHEIAMQVAAMNPQWINREEVPQEIIEKEKEIYYEEMKNQVKDKNILDRIVEQKLEKFYKETCLLEQPYIKDENITIQDLINQKIAQLGENIELKRFIRFSL